MTAFLQSGLPAPNPYVLGMVIAGAVILFGILMLVVKRYKRCPSNKILVIFGKIGAGQSARCLHGGGAFVWPLIQDYDYLTLDPIQIEIPLKGALSLENIRVNVPSVFTVAIGTDTATMQNAAIRLLGLESRAIMKQAEDIIFGQLRQVIASMKITDINADRDKFLEAIQRSLEPELRKIGLVLINVNITDITDESGYIAAIGKKAASTAIQQANIDVAEQEKLGAIGVADAERERQVQVAGASKIQEIGVKEAERDRLVKVADLEREKQVGQRTAALVQETQLALQQQQMRVAVAEANALAVTGENKAKADIAGANASLRVREAEAYQIAETKQREAEALVLQAQYVAQARAAEALASKVEMEQRAALEATAKASRAKVVVDAEAAAEQKRIEARADADAIFARLEAQAKGEYEILARKGQGLQRIVEACGGAPQAFQLLMLEHIEELGRTAATAISNIKFDKVIVWDGGQKGGGAAGFLQSMAGALPPVLQMMKDIGGVEMPAFFGKLAAEEKKAAPENGATPAAPPPARTAP